MRSVCVLIVISAFLSGCILPATTQEKAGKLLVEKKDLRETNESELEVTYAYPDVCITFKEVKTKTWNFRYGAPDLVGDLKYSAWGDCQEIILGAPFFASGVLTFGSDLLLFRYRPQSVNNMLYLATLLPAIQHTDMTTEPETFTPTGNIAWGEWDFDQTKKDRVEANRTINFVSESGATIYQLTTNENGETFADIREIYGVLFKGPEKAVAVYEMVSGVRKDLPGKFDSKSILEEVEKAGEQSLLNVSTDIPDED